MEEVEQLLSEGLIKPSKSPWASPVVLVPKKDGTIRLCMDFRRINTVTKTDPYPMSRIEDLIDGLANAQFVSTLDLTKGYWQVPMAKSSIPKTAFQTQFGKYQFNVMPFGLVGALASFQSLMNELLADHAEYSAIYMDDVSFSLLHGMTASAIWKRSHCKAGKMPFRHA